MSGLAARAATGCSSSSGSTRIQPHRPTRTSRRSCTSSSGFARGGSTDERRGDLMSMLLLAAPRYSGKPTVTRLKRCTPPALAHGRRPLRRRTHCSSCAAPQPGHGPARRFDGRVRRSRRRSARPSVRAGDDDVTIYHLSVAGFQAGRHRLPVFAFIVQSTAKSDTLRATPPRW